MDYVYTLGGQLKSINHSSLEAAKDPGGDSNDVFGITLDYYNGDYLRSGRNITTSPTITPDFNGNIKAARWANKNSMMDLSGSTVNQKGYLYNYDRNNWLTSATFGDANNSNAAINPLSKYKEAGLTYDANGNIKTLQRTNASGNLQDNLTYNYNANKNQLSNVADAAGVSTNVNDIGTQNAGNYIYDAIGQLTHNTSENLYYFYNTQGLVTEVKSGTNTIVKFFYNERGQRVRKDSYSGGSLQNTTYYALDLSGNTMAVYSKAVSASIAQTDLPIYGLSRLGVYSKADNSSNYEITDHLGNVRAVIKKISGNPVMQAYADYYPFGEQLPGRNSQGNYRYAFQGQEKDGETNMEAFQLRLWDGRIGRWLSPDPYGEFDSPYLGMGNNPISMIDPDGGQTIDPPANKKPIQLNEVVIQGKWSGLSKSFLYSYTKNNYGNGLSSGQIQNLIGRRFENAWNRYATFAALSTENYRSNNLPFFSPSRGGNVVPDGLGDQNRTESNGKELRHISIKNGIFVEVKAKNGNIYSSTSANQISGHISALNSNPQVKRYGGTLIIVTTSNSDISASVVNFAKNNHSKIKIAHVIAEGQLQGNQLQIRFKINDDVSESNNYRPLSRFPVFHGYVNY